MATRSLYNEDLSAREHGKSGVMVEMRVLMDGAFHWQYMHYEVETVQTVRKKM